MAANEIADENLNTVQNIVNRWIVDYYLSLALEAFKNQQYADFCGIKNVLDSVLVRSLESTNVTPTKIRVVQFLSLINEGETQDASPGSDQSATALQTALLLLEEMRQDCSIPQQGYDKVCNSVKEMIIVNLIKNNKFDHAKQMLIKHYPKPMVGKKAIFMGLINQRSKTHEVIKHIDFLQFKKEMLAFCQSLCSFSDPFLLKAAKRLIVKRCTVQDDIADGPDEQDGSGASSKSQIRTVFVSGKNRIIQRSRLEAAYKILAIRSDKATLAQLEEEVEKEEQAIRGNFSLHLSPDKRTSQDSEQDRLFLRGSCSPMEASLADQPPQTDTVPQTQAGSLSKSPSVVRKRQVYSVARLVVEPDSQVSLQGTGSQELVTEVLIDEPTESPIVLSEKDPQSPLTDDEVTKPSRKPRKRVKNRRNSLAESSADSEEDCRGSVASKKVCVGKCRRQSRSSISNSSKSQAEVTSSDVEEEAQDSLASRQKTSKQAKKPLSNNPHKADEVSIIDSSQDSSPSVSRQPVPQTTSTPQKYSAKNKAHLHSKWKQLFKDAKESKERWSDEESLISSKKNSGSHGSTVSISGHRKRKWTETETEMLIEGVQKFGEGNWNMIKSYYSFNGRSNINLKDRWRTLKRLNNV